VSHTEENPVPCNIFPVDALRNISVDT
jgi:hypothetical protein